MPVTSSEILASASGHLQRRAGHVFDVLTISKPIFARRCFESFEGRLEAVAAVGEPN